MIKETSGDSYEAARSLEQQLTFEQASAFFRSRNVAFGPSQMRTLHLIGPDGTYTTLAFLLSDQCNHTVKLAVFEGSKKSVFKDRQELTGSLLQQLEGTYGYIDRFNRTRAEFSGLDPGGHPGLPARGRAGGIAQRTGPPGLRLQRPHTHQYF